MSYGLTISRGYPWASDGSFAPIPLDDWNALIEASDRLTAISEFRGRNPMTGEEIVVATPNSAQIDKGLTLRWKNGYITADHFEEMIPAYREVATALNAEIFGEEGEKY
jgi:hypothetical protein